MRFQSETEDKYLVDWNVKVQAGQEHHFAFTFDSDEIGLYLDGALVDADTGFTDGMTGNAEDLVLGASTRTRSGDNDNLDWKFDGEISNLLLLDRPLEEIEILFLAESGGDIEALSGLYDRSEEAVDDSAPEEEDAPMDEDENQPVRDEGAEPSGGILGKILNIIISLFGMSSSGSVNTQVFEERLTEIQNLLNDMLPTVEPGPADQDLAGLEDEEEDILEML